MATLPQNPPPDVQQEQQKQKVSQNEEEIKDERIEIPAEEEEDHPSDEEAEDDFSDFVRFMTACIEGEIEKAKKLLSENSEFLNQKDKDTDQSPLDCAFESGTENAVLWLLDEGAEFTGQANPEKLPFITNAMHSYPEFHQLSQEFETEMKDANIASNFRKFTLELYRRAVYTQFLNMLLTFRTLSCGVVQANTNDFMTLLLGKKAALAKMAAIDAADAAAGMGQKALVGEVSKLNLGGPADHAIGAAGEKAGNLVQKAGDAAASLWVNERVKKFSTLFEYLEDDDPTVSNNVAIALMHLRIPEFLSPENNFAQSGDKIKEFANKDVRLIVRNVVKSPPQNYRGDLIDGFVEIVRDGKDVIEEEEGVSDEDLENERKYDVEKEKKDGAAVDESVMQIQGQKLKNPVAEHGDIDKKLPAVKCSNYCIVS